MRRFSRALLPLLFLAILTSSYLTHAVPAAGTSLATLALGPSPIGPPVAIGVEEVASGLVSPVQLVQAPGRNGRLFIVDQVGVIWGLNQAGRLMPRPFLDISSKITPLDPGYDERGLLGLAFHPDYAHNGRFFVFYTAPPRPTAPAGYDNTVTIAEYRSRGRQVHANAASERIVLQVDHPQSNHNGGTVAFGPDGYLYISIGDGGAGNDVGLGHVEDWYAENAGGNGQDITSNLLGNILRIDVDHSQPYEVPADNPFVGQPGLDEIWAYGLRNPYRFSFDMGGNHELLSMDAGQELWEEVSRIVKRGNYGWNVKEGTHCFDTDDPNVSPPTCPSVDPTTGEPLRDPVIEFANAGQPGGLSFTVVGGLVYRGRDVSELSGRYVYGGATASLTAPEGRLFVSSPQESGLWTIHELLINGTDPLGYFVKGFGQDQQGEVYVMASKILGPSGMTGTVFKIVRPG
jgi:glucose/arabinose dehydrogenase